MTRTSKWYELPKRLLTLAACLCIIFSIAIAPGHYSGKADGTAADTATITHSENGTTVVNTTSIAADLRGYGGSVPMKVYIGKDGRIDSILTLPNNETPEFLDVVRDEVIGRYIGRTAGEALAMKVDAVTGATMSSECVKGTLNRALALAQETASQNDDEASPLPLAPKLIIAMAVGLMAALLPLFIRSRTYRLIQLGLNVIVLGLYCGTFVSYSAMAAIAREPAQLLSPAYLMTHAHLLLLITVALIYPLFGKKGHYCAWCCPLGSLQDLSAKAGRRRQWQLPVRYARRLTAFRKALWVALMLLSWTGVAASWMDYELFSAFLWQTASWTMLLFLALCTVLSAFVTRPYCRFVCPTGTLLKM